jgi:hypothetical protein
VRLLADKIGLPLPKDDRGAVFIKNPQDVRQSSVELCPEDSEALIKTRESGFLLFKAEEGSEPTAWLA